MEQRAAIKSSVPSPKLRTWILCLFIAQPLLDILSYWCVSLHIPETVSILPRAMLFFAFGILGYVVSDRRRIYWIGFAAVMVFLAGHVLACAQAGYQDPKTDLINLMRVLQLPLFAVCMISCLKRDRHCARTIEQGLTINFWIIAISVFISLLTRSSAATYDESGYGVTGWFATTNAQSSILSMLVPVVILLQYRKRVFPAFCITAAAAFALLYFFGTRLAFGTIAVSFGSLVITALVTRNVARRYLIALGLLCAVCFGCVCLSPMYRHQHHYAESMVSKQSDSARMIREGTTQPQDFTPVEPEEAAELTDKESLKLVYGFYASNLCERFGTERVMEQYHYTSSIADITATRHQKIVYCQMLMEELPPLSRWFGIELSRMSYNGFNYDAENDFHGIYFLFGFVGLAMVLAFLLFFLIDIARALIRSFRRFFTLEAGAFGTSLLLALVYAYHTAGLLRRPNASFYLSMILAYIFYLLHLRPKGNEI